MCPSYNFVVKMALQHSFFSFCSLFSPYVFLCTTWYDSFVYFLLFLAKDRNAAGVGEAEEVDGSGDRGASGERRQPYQQNPLRNTAELQDHR